MKIHTAQYNYSGNDRLDITIKGAKGRAQEVAPTWRMVMDLKNGVIDEKEYIRQYNIILEYLDETWWKEFLPSIAVNNEITLVCFCRKGDFCHRVLLAEWLDSKDDIEYEGEK